LCAFKVSRLCFVDAFVYGWQEGFLEASAGVLIRLLQTLYR